MILYLHGFLSTPDSFKARLMAAALDARGLAHRWCCPALPVDPAAALALANDQVAQAVQAGRLADPRHELVVIGSSLGGYYAACVAARWDCRSVLLNPVIHGARDLATQVGEHRQYHTGEPVHFLPAHVQALAAMAPPRPTDPSRCYLLAAQGDEVLDWHDMADWYAGSAGRILPGSDHGLSDFAHWLPEVLAFALDEPAAATGAPYPRHDGGAAAPSSDTAPADLPPPGHLR